MTALPLDISDSVGLREDAVQLELARIDLAALASALRARLAQSSPSWARALPTSGLSPALAGSCPSLLGLDAWWRISADLRSTGTTLEAQIRSAVDQEFPPGHAARLRDASAVVDASQRRDIAAMAHFLRNLAAPRDCPHSALIIVVAALEETAGEPDPRLRCRRLRQALTDLRTSSVSA